MENECDFCKYMVIMPYSSAPDVISELIRKSKKSKTKCNKYMRELLRYTEMADDFLSVIYTFEPELHDMISKRESKLCGEARRMSANNFFDENIHTKHLISCNFCKRYTCDYHTKYSKFFKCSICKKHTSMCGWCYEREEQSDVCLRNHQDNTEGIDLNSNLNSNSNSNSNLNYCRECESLSYDIRRCKKCKIYELCGVCYMDNSMCILCELKHKLSIERQNNNQNNLYGNQIFV